MAELTTWSQENLPADIQVELVQAAAHAETTVDTVAALPEDVLRRRRMILIATILGSSLAFVDASVVKPETEPGTPPETCLDKQFIQSVRLLGDLGMSFDLCMRLVWW